MREICELATTKYRNNLAVAKETTIPGETKGNTTTLLLDYDNLNQDFVIILNIFMAASTIFL